MEHGRDSINAQWSPTDCIAQLSMHCMNIRFAGTEKVCMRPTFKLVNNISYVVRVIQKRFSASVEEVCKDILGKPDSRILKLKMRMVMPEAGESLSDTLQPYRHLMISDAMYSSAVFLLESGMFPQNSLLRAAGSSRSRRHYSSEVSFYRLQQFVEVCGEMYPGCSPLCVLLALSFSLSLGQLATFVKCQDDIGITAVAEGLIMRMSSSLSPFRSQIVKEPDSLTSLSDNALKRLIVSSLSDTSKSKATFAAEKFGSGTLEADVEHVASATECAPAEHSDGENGRGSLSDSGASNVSESRDIIDAVRRR
jgi:hypothetical protein